MRKKLFLLLIPFLTFAMTACEPSELKVDPEFAPYYEYVGNMKGIEIYCWEKDGAWECCLMPGTNRLKMVEEVRYSQENYPCPIAQMKIILQSYSEEEREYAYVAIVSTPPVQSELAHSYDEHERNEAKYLEVYTLLGLGV